MRTVRALSARLPPGLRGALGPAAIAILAGTVVYVIAHTVFPYHSSNHDEAVYLMQASMLLEGRLELFAGELTEAFRPWFFVEDGDRLYPKYQPVPAAVIATAMAVFGDPRVALAAVAAGNTGLVYLLGRTVRSRAVGLVAAVIFAASPLALLSSAVFLPYAPTTFFNLVFIVAYLRSVRDRSHRYAALAGIAIGIAFFARPFTAVLVAVPFVIHASYRIVSGYRHRSTVMQRRSSLHGLTALAGMGCVAIALAYNYRLTGDPLLFPYEAFAPLDGLGFGRRRILDRSLRYTPDLAVRANLHVLWYFATRWFTAGILGTLAALGGFGLCLIRWRDRGSSPERVRFQRTAGRLLGGVVGSVALGNVLFWGNVNILATIGDPSDGFISLMGPIYHFDLLPPFAVFAAVAVVALGQVMVRYARHSLDRYDRTTVLIGVVVVLLVTGGIAGVANASLLSTSIERNAAHTAKYETAYEPIDRMEFEDDLVFLPTPYGQWQHHPFQYLRNEPTFDGPVVYALEGDPARDFEVIDAYPDRSYHRYDYRGDWTSVADRHVTPTLEPLEVVRAETASMVTTVGVPAHVEHAVIRLEGGGGTASRDVVDPSDGPLSIEWFAGPDRAGQGTPEEGAPVELDSDGELVVTITLVQPDGSTLTYRQELTYRTDADHVELLWPPERYVCPLVTDCGPEGRYVPDEMEDLPDGVWMTTEIDRTDDGRG